jgi:hypothetical protein
VLTTALAQLAAMILAGVGASHLVDLTCEAHRRGVARLRAERDRSR